MIIVIKAINCKVGPYMEAFLTERVKKLETFYTGLVRAEVTVKRDNADKSNGIHCEILINKRGKDVFAKAKGGKLAMAAADCIEAMRSGLRKAKTKAMAGIGTGKVVFHGA